MSAAHGTSGVRWAARGLLLAFLVLGAGRAAAEQPLLLSGHRDWPPFSWQENERIVGIGAALAASVLDELGLPYESRARGNWKRVQEEAKEGQVDVIVAAYRTEERRAYLIFPAEPYTDDANVIWVKQGRAFAFERWEDLIGKRGTAMLGESYGEAFDAFLRDKLTVGWVNSPQQNFSKLMLERADYYPFSRFGGQIQIARLGYEGRIEALPTPLSTEGVYLAISAKSRLAAWLPQIEAAIARRRADGSIEQLVRTQLARAVQAPPVADTP